MNSTTPQSMSDLPELPNELVRVGGLLSNAAYNLAQHADLSPEMRESLDKLRKQWDAARTEYGRLCRATAEQAGKVEGAVAWECKIVGRDVGWHACTKEQHDNIKLTGFYNGPGGAMCEARELFAQPVVIGYDDASGRDRDWSAKPTQPAATQMPVAWVNPKHLVNLHAVPQMDRTIMTTPLSASQAADRTTPLYATPVTPSREVEALKRIVRVLGPVVPASVTDEGARWEWRDALETAVAALAPVQASARGYHPKTGLGAKLLELRAAPEDRVHASEIVSGLGPDDVAQYLYDVAANILAPNGFQPAAFKVMEIAQNWRALSAHTQAGPGG